MEKIIVLDTETANSMDDPMTYDIGFAVVDYDSGDVIETHSYAIADVFLDKEMMNTAYYKEKVPIYWEEIKAGTRKLAKLETVRRILAEVVKKYGVKKIFAHNARFDYLSCTKTRRYMTSSAKRYFYPYGVELHDSLKLAREYFKGSSAYDKFCADNGYLTKRGQNRFTAEILFRFISGNNEFEEAHRGIDDVMIEKEIVMYCKDPVIDSRLWRD